MWSSFIIVLVYAVDVSQTTAFYMGEIEGNDGHHVEKNERFWTTTLIVAPYIANILQRDTSWGGGVSPEDLGHRRNRMFPSSSRAAFYCGDR